METAIKKLEVTLVKTESDLNRLSNKLDKEFCALSEASEIKSEVKVSEIMKRAREIKTELETVALGIEEFQKDQKEIMAEVKERLAKISDQFNDLGDINPAAQ